MYVTFQNVNAFSSWIMPIDEEYEGPFEISMGDVQAFCKWLAPSSSATVSYADGKFSGAVPELFPVDNSLFVAAIVNVHYDETGWLQCEFVDLDIGKNVLLLSDLSQKLDRGDLERIANLIAEKLDMNSEWLFSEMKLAESEVELNS
jgi:hypothetical protein